MARPYSPRTEAVRDSVKVLRHYVELLEQATRVDDTDAMQRASATIRQEAHTLELVTESQGTVADLTRFNGRVALS